VIEANIAAEDAAWIASQQQSFARAWENDEDAEYDSL
jgi:hypothetical protein